MVVQFYTESLDLTALFTLSLQFEIAGGHLQFDRRFRTNATLGSHRLLRVGFGFCGD